MSKFQVGDKVMSPGFGYGTVVTNAPDAAGDILVAVGSGSRYNYVLTNESGLTLVPDTVMVTVEMTRDEVGEAVEHLKILGGRYYPWFGHFVEACRTALEKEQANG